MYACKDLRGMLVLYERGLEKEHFIVKERICKSPWGGGVTKNDTRQDQGHTDVINLNLNRSCANMRLNNKESRNI